MRLIPSCLRCGLNCSDDAAPSPAAQQSKRAQQGPGEQTQHVKAKKRPKLSATQKGPVVVKSLSAAAKEASGTYSAVMSTHEHTHTHIHTHTGTRQLSSIILILLRAPAAPSHHAMLSAVRKRSQALATHQLQHTRRTQQRGDTHVCVCVSPLHDACSPAWCMCVACSSMRLVFTVACCLCARACMCMQAPSQAF